MRATVVVTVIAALVWASSLISSLPTSGAGPGAFISSAYKSAPERGLVSTLPIHPFTLGVPTVVQLVPGPSGTGPTCVIANSSNPYPTATSGFLNFQGDLFNLPPGSVGDSQLCYNSTTETLSDHTEFSQLPGAPQYGVVGYPEAIYGENIYGGPVGLSNPDLPLPHDQIQNLTNASLWISVNYSVGAPGNSPYDFAWDDWFSALPANSTSAGNVGNRIELMIWYSNDIGMYLPQTPISVPSFVDGRNASGNWFVDHYCQGSNEVTFDYLYAPTGSRPGYGLPSAQIALNFTYLLENVSKTLRAGACWASAGIDIGSLYFDNSPLGAEFYPTTSGTADVNWTVSSMCYILVTGAPEPQQVSCGQSAQSGRTTLPPSGTPSLALQSVLGFAGVGLVVAGLSIAIFRFRKGRRPASNLRGWNRAEITYNLVSPRLVRIPTNPVEE